MFMPTDFNFSYFGFVGLVNANAVEDEHELLDVKEQPIAAALLNEVFVLLSIIPFAIAVKLPEFAQFAVKFRYLDALTSVSSKSHVTRLELASNSPDWYIYGMLHVDGTFNVTFHPVAFVSPI